MRSSIACSRCRRSKIKCVNAGIDTTCRACESSGRECLYPTPATGTAGAAAAAKRDLAAMADGDERNGGWESPKRHRSRKTAAAVANAKDVKASSGPPVLDAALLTVKVWESLFDLFQLHFATILPFLHPTTFLSQIRQLSANPTPTADTNPNQQQQQQQQPASRHSQSPAPRSEPSPLILLGVLALTARFHPQLAQHHSPSSPVSPCNPLAASEFYANALRARLVGNDGSELAVTDISRVQGLLMLGLHDWGMCRGTNASIYVGMAVRLAQAMGLSLEPEQHSDRFSRRSSMHSTLDQRDPNNSDDVIEQETKRRTFWSCFILDRCLSGGRLRPRMIKVRDVGIQLPSDNAFAFGERVRTSRLSENAGNRRSQSFEPRVVMPVPGVRQHAAVDDLKLRANGMANDPKQWSNASHRSDGAENGIDRWEVGAEECVLSRLIRILRIWGSIAKWSCAGGRRFDQYPPWHPESQFHRLKELLIEFQEGLPRNLQYSARNTDTHIMYKNTLAPYSLMHIIYFLSVIVLHRPYLQFLPLRAMDPQGPLDEPSFPPDRFHVPDGFWRDVAREVFRASRHLIELVKTCDDRGVLMETPLVGFAIYNAAFVGVYAAHFSHMDQEGYICSKSSSTDIMPGLGGQGQAEIRKAIEILGAMRPRLPMAVGWFRTIHRLHTYFAKARQDYQRTARKLEAPSCNENSKLAPGGNPDELRLLEKLLSDMGVAEDQAPDANGVSDEPVAPPVNGAEHNGSDAASNHVKSEAGDAAEANSDNLPRREPWVPVNGSSHEPREPDRHDGTVLRPIEAERWANLPGPPAPPSYNLPSIHHHSLPPASGAPPHPASGVYASSPAPAPYLPSTNRLQPLHPWPSARQPPPPPYSQSLPALNAAAQQNFPMPPLATMPPHAPPPALQLHHHHAHLTPSRMMSPLPPDLCTSAAWVGSLGGDDVIAFMDGEGVEKWSRGAAMAQAGVQSGWLTMIWDGYGH
ncbi:conserved hypothetical protein [Uncinocarpus reesii 1704]|uniref:Zn(2)-C6 fungal-type domain-containing protein n=1 Tax=Uncinocarpus reesii (strain UAMH 1704) TaxID=336963 RepID=C4JDH2_UNCRE|nr:uncharacterized protein UREG_00698 [Uncinocarpus reesii 1704]EEP75851.1 conserved hypothetical protein [Uncinocarpus reesii 1704]